MDTYGLVVTVAMVIVILTVYVTMRWGSLELEKTNRDYYCGVIPCYIIYISFAFLLTVFSLYLYFLIVSRESSAFLLSVYYVLIILGITGLAWFLFEYQLTRFQVIGLVLIIVGLIAYCF